MFPRAQPRVHEARGCGVWRTYRQGEGEARTHSSLFYRWRRGSWRVGRSVSRRNSPRRGGGRGEGVLQASYNRMLYVVFRNDCWILFEFGFESVLLRNLEGIRGMMIGWRDPVIGGNWSLDLTRIGCFWICSKNFATLMCCWQRNIVRMDIIFAIFFGHPVY